MIDDRKRAFNLLKKFNFFLSQIKYQVSILNNIIINNCLSSFFPHFILMPKKKTEMIVLK